MHLLFLRAQGQDREIALGILAALEEQLPQDTELITVRAADVERARVTVPGDDSRETGECRPFGACGDLQRSACTHCDRHATGRTPGGA